MSGNGGNDNMVGVHSTAAPATTMNGNGGRDYMIGDDGTLTRDGGATSPSALAGAFGGTDAMNGGPDRDFMWGQGAVDTMNGNAGNDYMLGGPANDVMNGNDERRRDVRRGRRRHDARQRRQRLHARRPRHRHDGR